MAEVFNTYTEFIAVAIHVIGFAPLSCGRSGDSGRSGGSTWLQLRFHFASFADCSEVRGPSKRKGGNTEIELKVEIEIGIELKVGIEIEIETELEIGIEIDIDV